MSSGNKIRDVVEMVREYRRTHGKYPKGTFSLTKGKDMGKGKERKKSLRKSKGGKIRVD